MADNFDLMATALKAVCPNNEILLDNAGKPSVMVRIPKMTYGTTANSVKMDWISNHLRYSKSITVQTDTSRSCGFGTIDCDSTIGDAAKLVLQCLGMLPYKSTDLCPKAGHLCWFNNGADERAFFSGGGWGNSSFGLASFDGRDPRSLSWVSIGFRAAFAKLPTA